MSHRINLNSSLWTLLLLSQISPIAVAHNIKTSGEVAATFHIEPNHNPKAGEPAKAWFALTRKGGKIIELTDCNCKLEVNLKSHPKGRVNREEVTGNREERIIDSHSPKRAKHLDRKSWISPMTHPPNASPPLPTSDSLKPPLKSISTEQYQGIPGAEIIFPQAGEYELEFSGTPKAGANFQPFEFSYTVTVRAGTIAPTVSPSPQGVNNPQNIVHHGDDDNISQSLFQGKIPVLVLVVVFVLGGIGLVVRWLKMGKF
ncbi:hypothetical protein [Limnofasciculus baicalensis]|uniref:Transketolase n=1 Tax=Limnofasciculus baicalensis BBK-W-15 TaxID=2699891 RepID=A0AAE3GU96_9CYAN|nr:hypothetical protein [Limnofasciculus baicalensis]MCP2730464.1 hypothetical protein [Limnofasciculus baicalensis BBK-W-15]